MEKLNQCEEWLYYVSPVSHRLFLLSWWFSLVMKDLVYRGKKSLWLTFRNALCRDVLSSHIKTLFESGYLASIFLLDEEMCSDCVLLAAQLYTTVFVLYYAESLFPHLYFILILEIRQHLSILLLLLCWILARKYNFGSMSGLTTLI